MRETFTNLEWIAYLVCKQQLEPVCRIDSIQEDDSFDREFQPNHGSKLPWMLALSQEFGSATSKYVGDSGFDGEDYAFFENALRCCWEGSGNASARIGHMPKVGGPRN